MGLAVILLAILSHSDEIWVVHRADLSVDYQVPGQPQTAVKSPLKLANQATHRGRWITNRHGDELFAEHLLPILDPLVVGLHTLQHSRRVRRRVLQGQPVCAYVPQQRGDFCQQRCCSIPALLPLGAFFVAQATVLDSFLALALKPRPDHTTAERGYCANARLDHWSPVCRHLAPSTAADEEDGTVAASE
jgi:hypothetical protein